MASWMALVTELPGASSTSTGPSAEGVNFVPPVRFLHPETTWKNMEFCPKSRGSLNSFSLWNSDNYGFTASVFRHSLLNTIPGIPRPYFFGKRSTIFRFFRGFPSPILGQFPRGWPQASDALRDSQLKVRMNKTDVCSLCWWHQELGEKTVYMICVYDMCVWYAHPICGFMSSYRVDLFPIWGFGPASHEECGPSLSCSEQQSLMESTAFKRNMHGSFSLIRLIRSTGDLNGFDMFWLNYPLESSQFPCLFFVGSITIIVALHTDPK